MRAKTAVVLGAQWGDEGKGKIVDVLSERFSAVARYAGGHNAGHTVIIGEQKFVLQLIPCGVLRPGCKGIIGNGVVLDPIAFLKEVARLRELGVEVDEQLFVSNRAQVILPYHRMIELAAESAPGRKKIGTTSRGIGPAYEDKMARSGLRIVDLLHPDAAQDAHRGRLRGEERNCPRAVWHRSAGPGEDVRRVCGCGRTGAAVCGRYRAAAEQHSGQGRQRDVRGRAGNDAGYRPWDLSVCDFVLGHGGRRGYGNRRWTDGDRHGDLGHQGLCDAGGRGTVSRPRSTTRRATTCGRAATSMAQ